MRTNTKGILLLVLVISILSSGCASQTKSSEPVSPEDVFVTVAPVAIKEYQEQSIAVTVENNATQPIDSVSVDSFDPLSVIYSSSLNIPGKTDKTTKSSIDAMVKAPGFKTDTTDSSVTVSYVSGSDENGAPVLSTKSAPVQITILPDAKLQFLGFVKNMSTLRDSTVQKWELKKGENATISFSVKNNGQSTIDANSLIVMFEAENELMAGNTSLDITQAMAKNGSSYTKGVVLPVKEDAPNGETAVNVKLMMGDYVLDEQTLTLVVKL
ncbi:MAG: hypothetical protein A4E24_01507 [Methanomethylovorans sp. PtaU1.Bin093]|uniref:hypothetical protein n=1 Tax=Methanomethylovorans sp. PtaU1.Bin093 TaxID=1811679 RepID=UPI0009D157DA|nr:hypothetical protein [Methanomethylovorans sp. PtaU1.Bin093]OPY19781.1 MAG: hypothetical protein A4E24_01507 [Methanomethylovorans sp. PtaU1.Bin093]